MNQTVLPQLQEVEANLVAQEEALIAQLAIIQEKRSALQAVLPLFGQEASADLANLVAATIPSSTSVSEEAEEEPVEDSPPAVAPAKTTAKAKAKATKTGTAAKATAAKAKGGRRKKKKDGRAASWQKYTRKGVGDRSIPEAVRLILATQPEKDFKIVEVMGALFEDKMPRSQYLKARNRISNVLSGGVRSGEWYKGERGAYRLTKAS